MTLVFTPTECPACLQVHRITWRYVNGTEELVLVCDECEASWAQGDDIVCATYVLVGYRLDANGRPIHRLDIFDPEDPPLLQGTRTMSNRARKRRRP